MRISLVLAAVLAAVVAFAVLRPEDEPAVATSEEPASARTPAADTADEPESGAAAEEAQPTQTAEPRPEPPLLRAGSVRKLSARRGETVAFRVRHGSEEELHVHGYDIARRLPAGRTVTVRFPARLEGIFDIELEHSHTQIGSLRVGP